MGLLWVADDLSGNWQFADITRKKVAARTFSFLIGLVDHVVQSIDSDVKWASGRVAKAKRTSCTSSLTPHGLPGSKK